MKNLKITLWICGLGCLSAIPFIFLPWRIIGDIVNWFGVEPIPDVAAIQYFTRIVFGVFGMIGIFFIILARNPLVYGLMIKLGGYGLITFGLLALILGVVLNITFSVFLGDAIFGIIFGIAILLFSSKAKKELEK
jgi:hypothetical protein